jgi:hypothetical protein
MQTRSTLSRCRAQPYRIAKMWLKIAACRRFSAVFPLFSLFRRCFLAVICRCYFAISYLFSAG